MTDIQKIKLQRWWMKELQAVTRKVMQDEQKRQDKAKAKAVSMLGDLNIERREDIDDLYGYGVITDRKRDKLIDIFEQMENPDEMYQAKLDLLQDAYSQAAGIMKDLGQEV